MDKNAHILIRPTIPARSPAGEDEVANQGENIGLRWLALAAGKQASAKIREQSFTPAL